MPLFISFEGPDGSGKSTQARLLAAALRERGRRVTETREPGATPLGEQIREVLLHGDGPPATPLAMAFLLSAARTQLVTEVISPALQEGQIVITDRFADSTIAYQACGLGLDESTVRILTDIATGKLYPDVVVYVDIEPVMGLQRISARGPGNKLDDQALSFHQRVRAGYLRLARNQPERWLVIDGASSPNTVHDAIMQAIEPHLEEAVYAR